MNHPGIHIKILTSVSDLTPPRNRKLSISPPLQLHFLESWRKNKEFYFLDIMMSRDKGFWQVLLPKTLVGQPLPFKLWEYHKDPQATYLGHCSSYSKSSSQPPSLWGSSKEYLPIFYFSSITVLHCCWNYILARWEKSKKNIRISRALWNNEKGENGIRVHRKCK